MAKKKTKKVVSKKKATKKKAWKSINVTGKKVDDKIKKLIAKGVACYHMNVDNYQGCGNGFVVVNKHSGLVERMEYTHNGKVIKEQNIMMSDDAGDVLAETLDEIKVRANFSCGTACLF
jgi:hypothetical protein